MQLSKNEVQKRTNSNISKLLSQPFYKVEYVDAFDLLTFDRIDILIKFLYVKSLTINKGVNFHKDLYLEHIKLFNYFVEADSTNKVGKNVFVNKFNDLINVIKTEGFDNKMLIPIDANSIPLDGAHRIAIAAFLGMRVPTIKINTNNTHNFNCNFFENRGLSSSYLDYISIEYAKLKSNTHTILIWPKAKNNEDAITELISDYGSIVRTKKVNITYNGLVNLLCEVYKRESWLGNYNNDFEGAHSKSSQCYSNNNSLRAFLFEPNKGVDLIELKDKIRTIFKIQKHSVHINDTFEETLEIVDLIFDDNNIHRLNCASRKEMSNFNRLFKVFENYVIKHKLNRENIAIIGGVLALFGVKDVTDIDYISTSKIPDRITDEIEEETKKLDYISYEKDSLVHNPNLYFNYKGFKFSTIDVISKIKKKRGNLNDKYDVEIINNLKKNKVYSKTLKSRLKLLTSFFYYKRLIKQVLLRIRYILYQYVLKK